MYCFKIEVKGMLEKNQQQRNNTRLDVFTRTRLTINVFLF